MLVKSFGFPSIILQLITYRYMGDDYFDRYDPTAKMDEKEDAGEAYIYVKTDLDAPKDEKLASRLIRSLPDEGERSQGLYDNNNQNFFVT